MDKQYQYEKVITMPAGTYVLGDPCYVISGKEWSEALKTWYNDKESFIDGLCEKIVKNNPLSISRLVLNGRICLFMSTGIGDGTWYDYKGRRYGVDAGMLGLVQIDPETTPSEDSVNGYNHIFKSDTPFEVTFSNGTLYIGDDSDYTIDIAEPDEEEEEGEEGDY